MRRPHRHHTWILAALALAVTGCNRGPDGAAQPAAPTAQAPVAPPSDVVAAVSLGEAPPLKVGFELATRPVVGVRSSIALTLTPDAALAGARVELSSPGVQVAPEQAVIQLVDLRPGTPIKKEISITPQRAGLTELLVQLSVPTDGGVRQGGFAIPLLVSGVVSDKADPAPAGNNGNPDSK